MKLLKYTNCRTEAYVRAQLKASEINECENAACAIWKKKQRRRRNNYFYALGLLSCFMQIHMLWLCTTYYVFPVEIAQILLFSSFVSFDFDTAAAIATGSNAFFVIRSLSILYSILFAIYIYRWNYTENWNAFSSAWSNGVCCMVCVALVQLMSIYFNQLRRL